VQYHGRICLIRFPVNHSSSLSSPCKKVAKDITNLPDLALICATGNVIRPGWRPNGETEGTNAVQAVLHLELLFF
jgi:hypothetical protein